MVKKMAISCLVELICALNLILYCILQYYYDQESRVAHPDQVFKKLGSRSVFLKGRIRFHFSERSDPVFLNPQI